MAYASTPSSYLELILCLFIAFSGLAIELKSSRRSEITQYFNSIDLQTSQKQYLKVEDIIRQWAPLVWLSPGETFFPSSVADFLLRVTPFSKCESNKTQTEMPEGKLSECYYLVTHDNVEKLLEDRGSFLYGRNPKQMSVPIYAVVTFCNINNVHSDSNTFKRMSYHQLFEHSSLHFHVTYWMFYPFNEGKTLCTIDTRMLGPFPIPMLFNKCLGKYRKYGSHVGDWEHMSLYFSGREYPDLMYVSVHDTGAYYKYDTSKRRFLFLKQEPRKSIIQKATFPKTVNTFEKHPILFAAQGSHGLWSSPGKHKFFKVPRLYDLNGYGIPWYTWKNIVSITSETSYPSWMRFRGKWGNPKSDCHPLSKFGLNICKHSDGPTGVPLKKSHFKC